MSELSREKILTATEFATVSDINNMTADRIEALVGGHGMLNLSVYACANVIIDELRNGGTTKVTNANLARLPMETMLEKCVNICKKAGCDPANAALISAVMMYLAGSSAQVGIPAGNRKLGALARMIAGADRCGVSNIPTAKTNNKISGFPAVAAIYQAMVEGKLTEIDGHNILPSIAGSVFYGHGALGEDYVFAQLAENGARVGTQAMMDAYCGAGMRPHAFSCAIFGAAAILEIVHPDAEVSEEYGPYGKFNSAMLAGRSAAATAGLPPVLHMRGTNEEYDTGRLIGDLGLILKDVGGVSVIGMMALNEIISCFKEGLHGGSCGFTNSPLGHICGYGVVLMKALLHFDGDEAAACKAMIEDRIAGSFHPELALCSINITARKTECISRGPVTNLLIASTEPYRVKAISWRANYAYDQLAAGVELADVVKNLDTIKLNTVEQKAGEYFTKLWGEKVTIKVNDIHPGARRTKSKMATKYLAFDAYFNVTVTRGEKSVNLEGLSDKVIPAVAKGEMKGDQDIEWALQVASPVCADQTLSGNHLFNITIPSAIAVLMGKYDPEEAATIATGAAYITSSIPGCKPPVVAVAKLAKDIAEIL